MLWVNGGTASTTTSSTTTSDIYYYVDGTGTGTGTGSTSITTNVPHVVVRTLESFPEVDRRLLRKLEPGRNYDLPDGSKLNVDMNGNYEVVDLNAKVTYKGNRKREFNPFINASDLLEEFIHDIGQLGVRQCEVLSIPIELFINWLVIRAAEQDGDPIPDVPQLEAPKKHRCRCCGRFLSNDLKSKKIDFCNGDHMNRYLEKAA